MSYAPIVSSNPLVTSYRMLYISTLPYENSSQYQNSFICLGSVQSFRYTNAFNGTTHGIVSRPTNEAIYVDNMQGANGRLSVSTIRVMEKENTYGDNTTNRACLLNLASMRARAQLKNTAYTLRIYNVVKGEMSIPREMYVFIDSYGHNIELARPWELSLDFNFVIRNRGVGFS